MFAPDNSIIIISTFLLSTMNGNLIRTCKRHSILNHVITFQPKFMKKLIFIYLAAIAFLSFLPVFSQENKIEGQLELGYGLGIDGSFNSAQIFITPLYNHNKQLSFGLGVGFKYYYEPSPTVNLTKREQRLSNIPVYAAINYSIPVGRAFRPFLNLKTGYGITSQKIHFHDDKIHRPLEGNLDLHNTGGFFISPAIGVAYPINNKNTLLLSLAYDLQKINYKLSNDKSEKIQDSYNLENISLRLGLSF